MAAQPPGPPRTSEIDLHDIIPASEIETHPAVDRGEFLPAASTDDKLFQTYDSLRIGWSGWANVLFATLTVLGGILCTVRFFDSPELRRWAHAHEREYLYQRPADAAAVRAPDSDRAGARTYPSNAAVSPGNHGFSGGTPAGSNSQGPQLPPGLPQLSNPPGNSSGSEVGSRGRSSGGAESNTRNAVASRSTQSHTARSSHIAHGGMKMPNRSLRTPVHSSAKSDSRTLSTRNNVNQLGRTRSLSAMKTGAATFAGGHSMPSAMRSGTTVLRGSALNLAGLAREAGRETVRRERGAMNRH